MSENTVGNSDRSARYAVLCNLQRDFSLARLQNMEVSALGDEDCIRAQLLKLVECPVCYESMTQTEMCVNGHTVCVRCRRQLNICPVCNKAFGNIRNRLGESVSELLAKKHCSNASRGCNQFLDENDCTKHELGCRFRLYICKVCSNEMCFMELKDHVKNIHQSSIIVPFVPKELTAQDVAVGQITFSLIEFNGDLFWFWRKHTEAKVFFGLQYCGDDEKRLAYIYNLQLVSKNEKSDFEFTGPALPDVKRFNKYKYPEDYAVLSKAFMGEGAKFQVSVSKA